MQKSREPTAGAQPTAGLLHVVWQGSTPRVMISRIACRKGWQTGRALRWFGTTLCGSDLDLSKAFATDLDSLPPEKVLPSGAISVRV